jgi:hypothetical protein
MTEALTLNPIFVKTANVRNFETMMASLALASGEGRLGLIWGRAGRGKTRTAQVWAASNRRSVYVLVLSAWRRSQVDFLHALARELRITKPSRRMGTVFAEVAEALAGGRHTLFIDEPEKLPISFMELIRDLSDATGTPAVLIGEEDLPALMRQQRRVWSRTYQQVEFRPVEVADITQYVTASARRIRLSAGIAEALHRASGGDFRIVRRTLINLVEVLNARGTEQADEQSVAAAVSMALGGEAPNGRGR